jgi:hypothetical protein
MEKSNPLEYLVKAGKLRGAPSSSPTAEATSRDPRVVADALAAHQVLVTIDRLVTEQQATDVPIEAIASADELQGLDITRLIAQLERRDLVTIQGNRMRLSQLTERMLDHDPDLVLNLLASD